MKGNEARPSLQERNDPALRMKLLPKPPSGCKDMGTEELATERTRKGGDR